MKIVLNKILGVILFMLLLTISSYAQDETEEYDDPQPSKVEMQTLVSPGGTGGYGALTVGYSKIGDYNAFIGGVRGGVVLGHSFTIGIAGYGFGTEQFQNAALSESNFYQIGGGYGGILMEAIILPMKPVHISIPVIFGAGGLSYFRSYNFHNSHDWDNYEYSDVDHDSFFVVEPGVEVELNMLKFMRISLGGSYRYATDVSLKTFVDIDGNLTEEILAPADIMNGWNAYLTFKFGAF